MDVSPFDFTFSVILNIHEGAISLPVAVDEIQAIYTSDNMLTVNLPIEKTYNWASNTHSFVIAITNAEFGITKRQIGRTSCFKLAGNTRNNEISIPVTIGLYNTHTMIGILTTANLLPTRLSIPIPSNQWTRIVKELMGIYPITPKTSPVGMQLC